MNKDSKVLMYQEEKHMTVKAKYQDLYPEWCRCPNGKAIILCNTGAEMLHPCNL